MSDFLAILRQQFGENKGKADEPITPYVAFKQATSASYFLDVDTVDALINAVTLARQASLPVRVFGGGTNLLITDDGFPGLLIKNNCRKFDMLTMKGSMQGGQMLVEYALLQAEAGAITNQVVRYCIEQRYSGLEYQLGLPGTIGGAVYMNANYPKKDVRFGESVHSAKVLTKDGEVKEVDSEYFQFGFNTSSLMENGDVLLSVVFKVTPLEKSVLWERGTEAATYRIETQPKGQYGMTLRNIGAVEETDPVRPADLVVSTGLPGRKVGGAMISEVNPLYIVNTGEAKASDVIQLVDTVKAEVLHKHNVHLVMEANVVGN